MLKCRPMTTSREPVHRSHLIAQATPADVYAIVVDFPAYPRLFPELKDATVLSTNAGRGRGRSGSISGDVKPRRAGGPRAGVAGAGARRGRRARAVPSGGGHQQRGAGGWVGAFAGWREGEPGAEFAGTPQGRRGGRGA